MTKLDDLIDELRAERFAIIGYNRALLNAFKGWASNVGLSDDEQNDVRLSVVDIINDWVGENLARINKDIDELEQQQDDGPNPAKLGKEDLL